MTEEECFFLKIGAVTAEKGVMERNIEQHHMFEPGLTALLNYSIMTSVEEYRAEDLRKVIDSFGDILQTHLHDEIDTLLSLEKNDSNALRRAWEEKHQCVLKTCDNVIAYPLIYYLFDLTFA
jgi:hypothetical protein